MPSSPKDQGTLPELKRKFPPENDMDDWGLTTAQQVAPHFPLFVVTVNLLWWLTGREGGGIPRYSGGKGCLEAIFRFSYAASVSQGTRIRGG